MECSLIDLNPLMLQILVDVESGKLWSFLLLRLPVTLVFAFFVILLVKRIARRIPAQQIGYPGSKEAIPFGEGTLAFFLYILLTLVIFSPVLGRLDSSLLGPPEDNMQTLWNIWNGLRILQGDGTWMYTDMLCYPEGVITLYHSYTWFNIFTSLPVQIAAGPVAAYNFAMLLTFVLSALGMYLLCRYLIGDKWLSLLAGFLFAFNASHFAQALHHLNIASIQFVPFFVLYFIKSIREGGTRNLVLCAIFFFLNTVCDWNYMVFALYFIGIAYLYLAFRRKQLFLWDVLTKSALIAIPTVLLLSPWLIKMITVGLTQSTAAKGGHGYFVADFLSFFTPPTHHPLGDATGIKELAARFPGNAWEGTTYVGLIGIVTLAVVYRRIKERVAHYVLAIIGFALLAFGSTLYVAGAATPVVLPYRILQELPFLSNVRAPSRHFVYGYLFFIPALMIALQHILQRARSHRATSLLAGIVVALIIADSVPVRMELTPVALPDSYATIQKLERGPILDLPSAPADDNLFMMYQTRHGMPIVRGTISRKLSPTLIDSLDFEDLTRQKAQLQTAGVKYIVVHKELLREGHTVDTLAYAQVYDKLHSDPTHTVYRVE